VRKLGVKDMKVLEAKIALEEEGERKQRNHMLLK